MIRTDAISGIPAPCETIDSLNWCEPCKMHVGVGACLGPGFRGRGFVQHGHHFAWPQPLAPSGASVRAWSWKAGWKVLFNDILICTCMYNRLQYLVNIYMFVVQYVCVFVFLYGWSFVVANAYEYMLFKDGQKKSCFLLRLHCPSCHWLEHTHNTTCFPCLLCTDTCPSARTIAKGNLCSNFLLFLAGVEQVASLLIVAHWGRFLGKDHCGWVATHRGASFECRTSGGSWWELMRAVSRRPVLIRRATAAPAWSWTSMGNGTVCGDMEIYDLRLTPVAPDVMFSISLNFVNPLSSNQSQEVCRMYIILFF